jgi:multidrug efflux pump subunit AcrA (membrane-fusion protein)
MALDVLVPQMGESVLEGTILEWKVKVGDKVKLNQPLVELMTDLRRRPKKSNRPRKQRRLKPL